MSRERLAIGTFGEIGFLPISGPKPDGQLGGIVEVMLGTSARIGEVLAIRRRDIDVGEEVPLLYPDREERTDLELRILAGGTDAGIAKKSHPAIVSR